MTPAASNSLKPFQRSVAISLSPPDSALAEVPAALAEGLGEDETRALSRAIGFAQPLYAGKRLGTGEDTLLTIGDLTRFLDETGWFGSRAVDRHELDAVRALRPRLRSLWHLDETGVYVHVIADGGMSKGGDIAKAIACGADAVMLGSPFSSAVAAPARGFHWGMATFHPPLPRGARVRTSVRGSLREILLGPAHENDGRMNLFGALRTAMATCGYETVKEFQKAEVMVAPALQTEGKNLQRAQSIGMGA